MTRRPLAPAALAALASFAALAVSLASPAASLAETSVVVGHIVNVAGKVRIRKDGSKDTKDIRVARAGDVVMVGDIINTPSDGMIKLLMKDKSLMDLGPSSLFKVNSFQANGGADRQMESTIVYGSLRAAVTQKLQGRGSFKVRSPSATMGVRGTEFVFKSEMLDPKAMIGFLNGRSSMVGAAALTGMGSPIKSEITVLEGKVEVAMPQGGGTRGEGLMLAAGTQVVSQVGGLEPAAPAAQVLAIGELARVASTSRMADNTFSRAVVIPGTTKDEEQKAMVADGRESLQQQQQPESRSEAEVAQQSGGAKEGDKEDVKEASRDSGPKENQQQLASAPAAGLSRESDRGPASASAAGPANGPARMAMPAPSLAMASFVQTAIASVQLGSNITQTIRPADFVPAVPLSATGIQTQVLPNINQLHWLTVRVKLTP